MDSLKVMPMQGEWEQSHVSLQHREKCDNWMMQCQTLCRIDHFKIVSGKTLAVWNSAEMKCVSERRENAMDHILICPASCIFPGIASDW